MTGKEIMREFIRNNIENEIDYYLIQNKINEFASAFGVYHTPDSWTRYFRMVKDEFDLEEVPGRKWKTWRVRQMELAL